MVVPLGVMLGEVAVPAAWSANWLQTYSRRDINLGSPRTIMADNLIHQVGWPDK